MWSNTDIAIFLAIASWVTMPGRTSISDVRRIFENDKEQYRIDNGNREPPCIPSPGFFGVFWGAIMYPLNIAFAYIYFHMTFVENEIYVESTYQAVFILFLIETFLNRMWLDVYFSEPPTTIWIEGKLQPAVRTNSDAVKRLKSRRSTQATGFVMIIVMFVLSALQAVLVLGESDEPYHVSAVIWKSIFTLMLVFPMIFNGVLAGFKC
jgi:hypothetical protein